jgi:hypothetical protein
MGYYINPGSDQTPIPMGIGPIGTTNNVIFKRKFRWTFEVINVCAGNQNQFAATGAGLTTTGDIEEEIGYDGANTGVVPAFYVKVASRPSITFDETEINFLQGKMFIPGKATFETITVTYYDIGPVNSGNILNLYNWIGSVYNFLGDPTEANNYAGSWENPTMSAFARGQGGYGGTGILKLYDGGGSPIEGWELYDCWPQSVNFGDLDYSSSDECNIELTLRYTVAKWTNLCGTQQPDPCYAGCPRTGTSAGPGT